MPDARTFQQIVAVMLFDTVAQTLHNHLPRCAAACFRGHHPFRGSLSTNSHPMYPRWVPCIHHSSKFQSSENVQILTMLFSLWLAHFLFCLLTLSFRRPKPVTEEISKAETTSRGTKTKISMLFGWMPKLRIKLAKYSNFKECFLLMTI
mmetsp:Transcript_4649/g.10285  ORF Transcript_4649/g.10285 Transcript_4649/m.10285 type:complete len:149 (-) Transcript_4649:1898-2344(-)